MVKAPAIELPPDLGVRPEDVYRPLDPSLVPEVADLIAWLEENDPDVLAGVADVDRSLVRMMLEQTPLERLDDASRFAQDVLELQQVLLRDPASEVA